jgi:hypothetical protein
LLFGLFRMEPYALPRVPAAIKSQTFDCERVLGCRMGFLTALRLDRTQSIQVSRHSFNSGLVEYTHTRHQRNSLQMRAKRADNRGIRWITFGPVFSPKLRDVSPVTSILNETKKVENFVIR